MGVKWINKTQAEGTATMFPNYLLTNREFVAKFEDKYSALVGLDDDTDQIVLKPLSKDEDMDPVAFELESGNHNDQTATAIDQISNVQSPISNKIIKDNQLFILREGKTYTIMGQRVK